MTSIKSKLLLLFLVLTLTDCILDRSYYEALCIFLFNQKSLSALLNNKSERPSENSPKSTIPIETLNPNKGSNKSMLVTLLSFLAY